MTNWKEVGRDADRESFEAADAAQRALARELEELDRIDAADALEEWRRDDAAAPARGILIALALSAAFWFALLAIGWLVVR